ncbi:hypothetical protein HZS_5912 [Henneguya salminicola]|nr:hypothetical protein HZS_5912 [Henneguya salminicola]
MDDPEQTKSSYIFLTEYRIFLYNFEDGISPELCVTSISDEFAQERNIPFLMTLGNSRVIHRKKIETGMNASLENTNDNGKDQKSLPNLEATQYSTRKHPTHFPTPNFKHYSIF